jgi:anaerobic selenocysteine-containing dehydrogenase
MDAGDVTDRTCYWRLFFGYGTPNSVEHGAICDTPRRHGPKLMLGGKRIEPDVMRPVLVRQPDGSLKNDYSYKTKLIIYNGWNPFVATRINYESRGTVGAQVETGCKVIVVDPSHTNTAAKADMWLAPKAGTDPELFAAMLRYILEHDNPNDPKRQYIDWSFQEYSEGWDEFLSEFKSFWNKQDPVNGLNYFTSEWAAARTGLSKENIEEVSHLFGITKPAALVWGMQSPGHHYNGYVASIIGTALNVITGNLDAPGGAIDTELTKSDKGGSAKGQAFLKRAVTRTVNGKEVKGSQEELHMDRYCDWPSAWDDVVGDYPRRFLEGVTLRYGPFRGRQYPIKGFMIRTGNPVITGSATWKWKEALTAKDEQGNYKVELVTYIDCPFLETGLYADVILPEASYAERMSLSDIYPSHQVLYLRDQVIPPLHESKTPFEIMIALAKALHQYGDPDIKPEDFWEKYETEEDFWNEALLPSPGRAHAGEPRPYPKLPEGYKLRGTPESLEEGRVKIDHDKKIVQGDPLTVKWLREHHGVAVWPMSWRRFHPKGGGILKTGSKKVEFVFNRYDKYNKLIEEAGEIPRGLQELGWERYPKTFYWFETMWNPNNPAYAKYTKDYPFQLICGRVHHAMSGTQMVPWLGEVAVEGLWMPMNKEFEYEILDVNPKRTQWDIPKVDEATRYDMLKKKFQAGTWGVGTILISSKDAQQSGIQMGDLVIVENPLGKQVTGPAFVAETIRPGIIKIGFATGGRFSPGLGPSYAHKDYTPNHNELVDPEALSPIMGQPAYADMLVKVRKA